MEAFNPRVGLCSVCAYVRRVQGNPGSTFYLCELAFSDRRFRKYPGLPVVHCDGFAAASDDDEMR